MGYQAGNKNTTNGGNTFVGYQAGVNTTTGFGNVFVGSLAGNNNTTGSNNILIGYGAVHSTGNSHLNIGGLIKGRVWDDPAESKLTIEPRLTVAGPVTIDPTSKTPTTDSGLIVHGYMRIDGRVSSPPKIKLRAIGTATNPKLKIYGAGKAGKASLEVTEDLLPDRTDLDFLFPNSTSNVIMKSNFESSDSTKTVAINGTLTVPEATIAGVTATPTDYFIPTNRLDGPEASVSDLDTRASAMETAVTQSSNHVSADTSPLHSYASFTHGDHPGLRGPTGFTGLRGPTGATGARGGTGPAGTCSCIPPPPPPPPILSSQVYKKNIKPFKSYEKSLQNILSTPLFTYQYKEDHPKKDRMGVISEELPEILQIKDKGAPSIPDWPTVYGTLWAGIKALARRLQDSGRKCRNSTGGSVPEFKKIFHGPDKSL